MVTSLPNNSSTTVAQIPNSLAIQNSVSPSGHKNQPIDETYQSYRSGLTPGVAFSSGRLGHMWPLVNGVALGEKGKVVICLASDGSQQEGDDAEAARLAVAQNLNVKRFVDNNDVTIA
jgi:transketolase N-terminal domain/subunit